MSETANYCGLDGIEFTEFSSPEPEKLHNLFLAFGFSRLMAHKDKNIDYYRQGDIHFLLNKEEKTFSQDNHKFRIIHQYSNKQPKHFLKFKNWNPFEKF